ncbi:MAG: alpha-mannosidase [Anaerolineae bacterium]|nr:alpha-mannosidase [Anaerolineae bacterium]
MTHKLQWTTQKIARRIELIAPLVYRKREPLSPFRYKPLDGPLAPPPIGADDSAWEVIAPNTHWGTRCTDFLMQSSFRVPGDWDPGSPIALHLPIGNAHEFEHPEALVYIDGKPLAARDRGHEEVRLPDSLRDGGSHRVALHGWTGIGPIEDHEPYTRLFMGECALVQVDLPTRELHTLAYLTLEVVRQLDENNPVHDLLLNALDDAFVTLDTRDPLGTDAFYASAPAALDVLRKGIAAAGSPMNVDLVATGHAHIDVAWLWTLGQTVRKTGRTFSTALHLMDQYPNYTFSQSQPQLYRYAEQHYPELFERIKARVAEGRWEVMGGTWVEPDCNAIGAESLARQFVLGRSYFRKHFGDVDAPVLWLPDTFGYSWALPQLIKQAGLEYFVTHKMSWNQYNHMPHQIFWWQGLDGTRVLTYFLTTPGSSRDLPHATTYNGVVTAAEVFGTWDVFRQKELTNELLMPFGLGDGGGGPARDMIENIGFLGELAGAPRVRHGTVGGFLDGLSQTVDDSLPVWNGELYLEYHRGTLTSQSRNKRNNRKGEVLLHDAEFLAAFAALATGAAYPRETLQQAWELLCLNQFHDILPGSSIHAVYVDSEADYAKLFDLGESVRESALAALARALPAGTAVLAANTTSFGGRRIGLLDGSLTAGVGLAGPDNAALVTQAVTGGTLIEIPDMAPYSIMPLTEVTTQADGVGSRAATAVRDHNQLVLENAVLRVEIDPAGEISRVFDKQHSREVLPSGAKANALLAFEDRPLNFDAWDVDIFYEDRTEAVGGLESIAITETGPLRAAVQIKRRYRSSVIVQSVYLYADSRRIDFDTWIDWHEHHTLLKVAFPVDVLSPVATFDVQWGNVQRPTHRNTPWDIARFESCAHKWIDLSEGNYGAALLNDCKYGHDVLHNVMRLTLLKSATSPDPAADQGEHRMTYSLLPHAGDWRAEVVPQAYDLNMPVLMRRVESASAEPLPSAPFVSVDAGHVVIETVKLAEDGRGLIVRLYENQRNRGVVTLTTGFPIAEALICNLLEEEQSRLTPDGHDVQFTITPYQIVTLRLIPA